MDMTVNSSARTTMKGPIRKFSIELLNQGRKKSIDNSNSASPERSREQSRERERERSPPSARSSPRIQQERRPSIDRWKKAFISQASRLSQKVTSVTPRHSASSLDVSRSTATTATTTTTNSSVTATTTTRAQNHVVEKEKVNADANWTPTQTPPIRTPSPSSLSLSGSFSFMSSDFLSRENELLGGSFSPPAGAGPAGGIGEIDLDAAASAFPDISLDGSGDIPLPPVQQPAATGLGMGFDAFEKATPAPVREVKVTGDDEIERFEDQFPDIDVPASPPKVTPGLPQQPTFGAPPPFAPRPQPSAFTSTPILQQPLPDEDEPEPIRLWREKQAEEIKKRDEASEARRQEAITKAERSIDQFYEEYNAKKERNIKENKIQEQEYSASRTDALSTGTTWSRICEYVDLQNSQSKTLSRTGAGTTDLGRFKEVLLRLKREGEAAPGAAGY